MGNLVAAKSQPRIQEFEGVRGCLAWWVVLFHLRMIGGIDSTRLTRLESLVVLGGWQAVELFIILSGFVIAVLLDGERESYRAYIVRRFFRLAPVYYVVLAYAIVAGLIEGMALDRPLEQVLVHLTMLHGLVPDEVLKGSANAFVHPAWSISVEWQFYLVAPWLLTVIRRSATRALALLLGCLALSAILLKLYTFPFQATVVMRGGLFGVGIASYYVYRSVVSGGELVPAVAAYLLPAGIAVAWVFHVDPSSVAILWLVIFATVLAHHAGAESFVTRPLRQFLTLAPVVWLGKVSYCTYLCHMFMITPIANAMSTHVAPLGPRVGLVLLFAAAAPAILAVSAALHYLVEKPGMRFGKWLASRPVPAEADVVPAIHPRRPQRV
jgi:peptidoglycan/LPS O-acetylase OafA/YrhL